MFLQIFGSFESCLSENENIRLKTLSEYKESRVQSRIK